METDQPNLGLLSLAEITEAKTLWYKHLIQRIIETSKGFKQVQVSLHLFKDKSGIWRCRGRLSNADIELSAKHFENFAHNIGLRKKFVKKAICQEGNLSRRSSLNVPCAKDMKEERTEFHLNHHYQNLFRVTDDFAFTRVGVDFAGPVYVKPIFSTGKNASIIFAYLHAPRHNHCISNWFQIYLRRRLFVVY